MMDLVSVAIPVYNPDICYLRSAINSILNQSYRKLEIIISDDGALDAEAFLEIFNDDRITYIKNSKTEKGIFANLNNAIEHCKSKFVQIFCQDDIMYENFISEQIILLNKYPQAGMVFSQFDVVTATGEIHSLEERHSIRKTWPELIPVEETANYLLRFGCMPGNLSPVMVKKSVLQKIGYFDQNFPYAGDFEFWARMAGRYAFAYNVKPSLAIRRHHRQASNTLEKGLLVFDRKLIYLTLLNKCTLSKGKYYTQLYINQEIGVQQIYVALKNILNGSVSLKVLQQINTYPLNIFYSLILMIATLNGRLKYFKI